LLERVLGVFAIGKVSQNAEGAAMVLVDGEASDDCHAIRERVTMVCNDGLPREGSGLISAKSPQLFSPNEPEFR
jgi:hypothetical protein